MRTFKHFSRVIVFLLFSFWFGGLTFLVSTVIPSGNEVLGNITTMGMITQKVTRVLNEAGMLFIIAATLFNGINYKDYKRPLLIFNLILLAILLLTQVSLNAVHGVLDGFLSAGTLSDADRDIFMTHHRTYELLTPLSWIVAVIWCFVNVPRKRIRVRIRRSSKTEQINLTNP